jgi:hypothetical protein
MRLGEKAPGPLGGIRLAAPMLIQAPTSKDLQSE